MSGYPGHDAVDHQIIDVVDGEEVLVASQCPACGTVRYPPRELCPNDLATMRTIPLPREGVLHEAVRVDLAPVGFEAPYWMAHIDMPPGVRVYAQLAWDRPEPPETGAPVTYSVEVVRTQPEEILGPMFRPTSGVTR